MTLLEALPELRLDQGCQSNALSTEQASSEFRIEDARGYEALLGQAR